LVKLGMSLLDALLLNFSVSNRLLKIIRQIDISQLKIHDIAEEILGKMLI